MTFFTDYILPFLAITATLGVFTLVAAIVIVTSI